MSAAAPDFHEVLQIEPGREAAAFPLRLRQLLKLEGFEPGYSADGLAVLDALYEAHLRPGDSAGDFALLALRLEQQAGVGARPAPPRDDADDGLRFISGFDGLAEEACALAHFARYEHPLVRELCRLLVLETRRREGAVALPAHWTAGHFTNLVRMPLWSVWLARDLSCYWGQENPWWEALTALARRLFADPDTLDQAALELWDEALVQHATGNPCGAADALRLAHELPAGHYRAERMIEPLLASDSPPVRWRAAELLAERPAPRLLEPLRQAAEAETAHVALTAQIVALRRLGGGAAFEALTALALAARHDDGARLAARALAWVEHCPDRDERLRRLVRDRDRRVSAVGAAAYTEAKFHGLFAFGGGLAARQEQRLLDALRSWVRQAPSAPAPALLAAAFAEGGASVRVDADDAGRPGRVRVLTAGGTPLVDDHERQQELAARLARLPATGLAAWDLPDEDIQRLLLAWRERRAAGSG